MQIGSSFFPGLRSKKAKVEMAPSPGKSSMTTSSFLSFFPPKLSRLERRDFFSSACTAAGPPIIDERVGTLLPRSRTAQTRRHSVSPGKRTLSHPSKRPGVALPPPGAGRPASKPCQPSGFGSRRPSNEPVQISLQRERSQVERRMALIHICGSEISICTYDQTDGLVTHRQ